MFSNHLISKNSPNLLYNINFCLMKKIINLLLSAFISIFCSAQNPLEFSLPQLTHSLKITSQGVNMRKKPNANSAKLVAVDDGSMEPWVIWSDEIKPGMKTIPWHPNNPTFDVIDEVGEWYRISYSIWGNDYYPYINKKYTKVTQKPQTKTHPISKDFMSKHGYEVTFRKSGKLTDYTFDVAETDIGFVIKVGRITNENFLLKMFQFKPVYIPSQKNITTKQNSDGYFEITYGKAFAMSNTPYSNIPYLNLSKLSDAQLESLLKKCAICKQEDSSIYIYGYYDSTGNATREGSFNPKTFPGKMKIISAPNAPSLKFKEIQCVDTFTIGKEQIINYVFNGENADGKFTMQPSEKKWFDILAGPFISTSVSSQIINGKSITSTNVIAKYIIVPTQKGVYQLPAVIYEHNNNKVISNKKQITVIDK